MKKYYCVDQRYFDSGRVKVLVYDVKAEERPKNAMVENNLCDQYRDYFDTYEEAREFAKQCEKA